MLDLLKILFIISLKAKGAEHAVALVINFMLVVFSPMLVFLY